MNEKIRKLGVEAGLIVEEWDGFNRRQLDPAQQKFAELIVRECIDVCDGNHEHKNHTDTLFSRGVTTGIQLSQQAIKTHFGVEK
jgi:hypothetical protein